MEQAIILENVSYSYSQEKPALMGINLQVPSHSSCAIIGPSGCGKTTLLYALAGFIKPQAGHISIFGETLDAFPKEAGIILQDYALFPWKTVFDNVFLGLKLQGKTRKGAEEHVAHLLQKLGIYELRSKYPHELSGGEKQRTAIARSLILDPKILLLDEATSALDEMTKEELQNLLLEIQIERRTTIVQVTHSIPEAVFLGQKIVIMQQGKIQKILENPIFGDLYLRNQPEFF